MLKRLSNVEISCAQLQHQTHFQSKNFFRFFLCGWRAPLPQNSLEFPLIGIFRFIFPKTQSGHRWHYYAIIRKNNCKKWSYLRTSAATSQLFSITKFFHGIRADCGTKPRKLRNKQSQITIERNHWHLLQKSSTFTNRTSKQFDHSELGVELRS